MNPKASCPLVELDIFSSGLRIRDAQAKPPMRKDFSVKAITYVVKIRYNHSVISCENVNLLFIVVIMTITIYS